MTFSWKQSREAPKHVLSNVIELNSEYPFWKTLIYNIYQYIEDLVNIPDIDIPYLNLPTDTKTLEPLSKGHHNLIRIFSAYNLYGIHDNDPNGDDWVKDNSKNFNDFCTREYNDFIRLRIYGLLNSRPFSKTSYSNPY